MKFRDMRIGLFLILPALMLFIAPASAAEPCPEKLDLGEWYKLGIEHPNMDEQLENLKPCLKESVSLQDQLDAFSVAALRALSTVEDPERSKIVALVKKTLTVNAETGHASSQHNLATIHNMDPKSPLFDSFPVNLPIFSYWTKKAAANEEPRALFNMAVRLAEDEPAEGFPSNKELAYALFVQFETFMNEYPETLSYLSGYTKQFKNTLRSELGEAIIEKIESQSDRFDYKALSPD